MDRHEQKCSSIVALTSFNGVSLYIALTQREPLGMIGSMFCCYSANRFIPSDTPGYDLSIGMPIHYITTQEIDHKLIDSR